MPTEFTYDEGEPILVQFSEARGMQYASLDGAELVQRSEEALDKAMGTIRRMSTRVVDTIQSINLADRPAQVEVEFGLTLDAEAGALIAKVSTQASFNVKLVWENRPADSAASEDES